MDPLEVLGWLKKHNKFTECWHIHSVYEGSYIKPDGSEISATLTIRQIHSSGYTELKPRYSAQVVSSDGKRASSNPETSIQSALAGVHWEEIEK